LRLKKEERQAGGAFINAGEKRKEKKKRKGERKDSMAQNKRTL
jgi:hypothetical protein